MADPLSLLQQAIALVKIIVEHANVAKNNKKHAEWLARRASAFHACLDDLNKQHSTYSINDSQIQGVQILVSALEAANKYAAEIEQRTWYALMYKCKDDQRTFMEVDEDLARAAQLLHVALQVDVRGMLESLNDDLHAQFDNVRDEQKQLQAETNTLIETQFRDMFKLMSEALSKRGTEQEALEQVVKKHLAGVSMAVRNDPGVQASDLGVKSKEAFVVGVAKYEGQPLANPVNDAKMVAEALRRCDFRVMEMHDTTFDTFDDTLKQYEERLKPGTLAVFYFSGHGMEIESENWLLMSDLKPDADERLVKRRYGYPAQDVLKMMTDRQTAFNLVILDACRTVNVKRSTRSVAQGLGKMDPPALQNAGSLIAFATATNAVALDGDGNADSKNGLFTKHLLDHIEKPKPILEMMLDVQIAVQDACAGRQQPWLNHHFSSQQVRKLQLVDAAPPRAKGIAVPMKLPDGSVVGTSNASSAVLVGRAANSTAPSATSPAGKNGMHADALALLKEMHLDKYADALFKEGVVTAADLSLVDDEIMDDVGFSKLEKKKFQKHRPSSARPSSLRAFESGISTIRRGQAAMDSFKARGNWRKLANVRDAATRLHMLSVDATAGRARASEAAIKSIKEAEGRNNVNAIIETMKLNAADADVQEQACRALRSLTFDNSENRTRIGKMDGIELVVSAMKRHQDHADVQEWACRALGNLSINNDENMSRIAQAGGIEAVLSAMKRHKNHAGVQEQACWALRNLSINDENQSRIGQAGGIEAVLSAMKRHENHAGVQQRACIVFYNTSSIAECKRRAIDAGAIPAIEAAKRNHPNNDEVQRWGEKALGRLGSNPQQAMARESAKTSTGRKAAIESIKEAEGRNNVHAIIETMKLNAADADVQEQACWALRNLSADNSENRTRIGKMGGIEAVVSAMKRYKSHAGVQESACRAFINLSINDENDSRIGQAGGIEAVVEAMKRHEDHAGVQESACWALRNLSINDENDSRIGQADGIEALVEAMKWHEDHAGVQESACCALCNLSANHPENRSRIGQAGGIEALVEAMKRHEDHAGVQESACRALRNLSANPENRSRIGQAGGIEALIAMMRRHDDENEGVLEHACKVLRNLSSGSREVRAHTAEAGGIEAVVAAMRRHEKNAEVQELACMVLYFLSSYGKQRAIDAGATSVIEAALRNHPNNSGVQKQAKDALGRLKS